MNLNNIRLENSYHVSVFPNDSSTNKQWQFPDIPTLRDRKSIGLQLKLSNTDPNNSKTNYAPTLCLGQNACFITLVDTNGKQFVQQIPAFELNTTSISTDASLALANGYLRNVNGIFCFAPRQVAWSKCYAYFPTATGVGNTSLLFNIFYI